MVRPNGTKLTILQYLCTYSQQRDARETNSHFKWLCSKKTKVFLNFKIICYIKQGNLNFCCTGPTVPNFWQIKILTYFTYKHFFFHYRYFSKYDLFLLDYNKIHKKINCTSLGIVESPNRELWSV